MKKLLGIFLFFISTSLFARTLELQRMETKNIDFNRNIDSCISLYNNIDYICNQRSIFINMKETSVPDKIVIIFQNGTKELLNIRRKLSKRRIEKIEKALSLKKSPDQFRIVYRLNYGQRLAKQSFFQRRHTLSVDNKIGDLFWNINLINLENTFTQNSKQSERLFFNTTLEYKKLKLYYGNTSINPFKGSSYISSRIYGTSLLYKDSNFFFNLKSGKQGVQYNIIDKNLKSASVGTNFKKIGLALSYGMNEEDGIDIYGLSVNGSIGKDLSLGTEITEGKNSLGKKRNAYRITTQLSNVHKNKIFNWSHVNASANLAPDGFLFLTGNNFSSRKMRYNVGNNFDIYIPKIYGSLIYQNMWVKNELSNIKTDSMAHSLSYKYNKFFYTLRYANFGNNLSSFRNEQLGHSVKYRHDKGNYGHLFGLGYSTSKNRNSLTYTTSLSYSLLGTSFSWRNVFFMTQQQIYGFDDGKRNYSVRSSLSFTDKFGLDRLGFGAQVFFTEDQTGGLFNSMNNVNMKMTKMISRSHSLALDLRHGVNNTYNGKKEFQSFSLNYTYKFKTKHNVINNILYNRDKTIYLYNDINYNGEIDEEDTLLDGVIAEVYHKNGNKIGEYTIQNGEIKLVDIDRRGQYFVVLKNTEYEMINSSFSYEDSGKLFAQSFYNGKVDILDTVNNERVSTAELKVQCFGGVNYVRKYTASSSEGYRIKYPRSSKCILSLAPIVNENYYDIVFNDVLEKKDNLVIDIKLKRFTKLYGNIVDSSNKPLKNKFLKFKGKTTRTDEFGYYEFRFNKGELFKVNMKKDLIDKNNTLKNCTSETNFMTFSKYYLIEKKNNISCKKKLKK